MTQDPVLHDYQIGDPEPAVRSSLRSRRCYATDSSVRRVLFRRGFVIVPQRKPIRFVRLTRKRRTDLTAFREFKRWYLTTGDGDLELAL